MWYDEDSRARDISSQDIWVGSKIAIRILVTSFTVAPPLRSDPLDTSQLLSPLLTRFEAATAEGCARTIRAYSRNCNTSLLYGNLNFHSRAHWENTRLVGNRTVSDSELRCSFVMLICAARRR